MVAGMRRHTLVVFHAHPDDEAIATGGAMAKAASEGHRVVLVLATRGEHGEVAEGFLDEGEQLWHRRLKETYAAAEILGVARVEFLPYIDSGMMGTPENVLPGSFWQADVEEAAARVATLLEEERADVLTAYDENGVYGHPDHIQVHRVGVRAGELAGTGKVYMNTVDRDRVLKMLSEAPPETLPGDIDLEEFNLGVSAERVTTRLDVHRFVERKRQAMAAHASQISDTSWFLSMPPEAFLAAFGEEHYILRGAPAGTNETDLFEGLG